MHFSVLDRKYISKLENVDFKSNTPIFDRNVYNIQKGKIINNNVIFYKDFYYWFYFIKSNEYTYLCYLKSSNGVDWIENGLTIDSVQNATLKLQTDHSRVFIDENNINVIYIGLDKKNRPKYRMATSHDAFQWSYKNITIGLIGLIQEVVWDFNDKKYYVYFSKDINNDDVDDDSDDDICKGMDIYCCKVNKIEDLNQNIDNELIIKNNKVINFKIINNLEIQLYTYNIKNSSYTYINPKDGPEGQYYNVGEGGVVLYGGMSDNIKGHNYSYFSIKDSSGQNSLIMFRNLSNRVISIVSIPEQIGYIETDFILMQENQQLFLNSSVIGQDPSIKVSIKDKNGNIIEGYSFYDCISLTQDATRQVIAWGNYAYIRVQEPLIVKLCFELKNSSIYSFSLSDFKTDCAGNNINQIQKKSNAIIKEELFKNDNFFWWDTCPIIIFSGCKWTSTGGAQRPVALCRELVKLGFPIIYCSYANDNTSPIFVDGCFIIPSNYIMDFINSIAESNFKSVCIVSLANYYQYASILEEKGWSIIYDLLDDWDAFFDYKELLPDPDFKEKNLIDISSHIVCSSSVLIERANKLSPHENITLIRNGGVKTILPKTLPKKDMIYHKLPLLIYSGYLAGKWIDWECFDILVNNGFLTNVIGDIYNYNKDFLYPDHLGYNNNISFVGEKPFKDALEYISASDVGIIPFQYEKICNAVDPIKAYDYWAAGLWNIVTPVLSEMKNREYTIVADKHDWPQAIEDAYKQTKNGNTPTPEFIYNNSWESRAKDYKKVIDCLTPQKNKIYRVQNRPSLKDEEYKLRLTVEAPSSCNMKPYCPYCANADSRDKRSGDFCGDPNKWLDSLSWLSEEYGPLYLTSCYGEPLSSLESIHFYAEIAKGNLVDIVTNLIAPIDHIKILPVNGNIRFATSFHPHYWKVEQFIEKRLLVQKEGYHCGITLIVAYPPYIPYLDEWKKKIEDAGSDVEILTFYGMFKDKLYPENYTEEEKKIVLSYQNNFNSRKDQDLINRTKGKKCWAGCKYIFINWEGDVMQCPASGVRKLGNIIDRNFELFTEPQPCIVEFCGCADLWKYIVEE